MPDNPFANAFSPDRGGLTGFIGGLAGVPTQQQQSGSATGQALQELSQLKASGLDNQQAMLKFFQTPSGHDFFTHAGPDGLKQLTDGLQSMTAPAPLIHNVPEGGMLTATNPQTGQTTVNATNPKSYPPTALKPQEQMYDRAGNKLAENENVDPSLVPADVRTFQYMTKIAKLPQAEIQRLAALKADPTKGGPNSVMSESVDKMVKDFGLDERTGEAIKAGTIKIVPLKNELGQDTGDITVYDMSNPAGGAQLIKAKRAGESAATTPLPGTTPSTGAPVGVLPQVAPDKNKASSIPAANPKYFGDKATMFLGTGPVANALSTASGISESISPELIIPQGAQASDRKTLINVLRSDLSSMGQMGDGWVNKGVIEGYLKLAPNGSVWESPHEAIQKAIRLHEHIQQEIEAQAEVYHNASLPMETRKKAQTLIQGWQKVQRDMPTPDEMSKMEGAIRAGTAGAPTISGAASAVTDMAGKALTSVKNEAAKAGITPSGPNIDTISDPKELLAIDPRTLSREDKIKYLRKIDKMTGGKRSDAGSFQVAGDVQPLHPPGTFSSNTAGGDIINGMASRMGISPPNNVTRFPNRRA